MRAALLGAFDLLPQSAYYATYGEHPSLSYYDHPPMIGWLLWAWFALLGKSALTLRLAVFTTTLATQLALYALARKVLPGGRGDGAHLPATALAVFATTGMVTQLSFIAVPDVPLLLFWILALGALHGILLGGRRSPAHWLLAGALMGLALLAKYTALYLQGGLLLFLLAAPDHRRLLRTPGPWLAVAAAHAVALPVYVWNARHGWASFAYQSLERADRAQIDPDDLLGFLGSQALVLLPVPLFAFLWLAGRDTWRALRAPLRMERLEGPGRDLRLFLLAFSAPLFATCLVLSPFTWVKSNWPMPAYPAAVLLVALWIGRRGIWAHLATSLLLHLLLAVQIVWYPVAVESDDTWLGWSELAAAVEERVEELSDRHPDLFVFSADNYKTTAELRFYSDLEVYAMDVLGWDALHYEYLGEDPRDLIGRDALFVRSERSLGPSEKTERFLDRVREHFGRVRELEPIAIRRGGDTVRLFRIFLCEGYLGPMEEGPPGRGGTGGSGAS